MHMIFLRPCHLFQYFTPIRHYVIWNLETGPKLFKIVMKLSDWILQLSKHTFWRGVHWLSLGVSTKQSFVLKQVEFTTISIFLFFPASNYMIGLNLRSYLHYSLQQIYFYQSVSSLRDYKSTSFLCRRALLSWLLEHLVNYIMENILRSVFHNFGTMHSFLSETNAKGPHPLIS